MATDADSSNVPVANPASLDSSNGPTPPPPAMMALPVTNPTLPADASTTRKFYTITAALRETYDDNVNTANEANKVASLETEISPSVLVDLPMTDSSLTARYTLDLTYYSNEGRNNGGGTNNGSLQLTHEFVAQYSHSFSDRFNLNVAERFRYYTEPSLFESTGTNYRNGPYIANTINGSLSAQWTPLLSTTTTYSNTIVKYEEAAVAEQQNSVENTGNQTFNFSILPKISASVGGIADNTTYNTIDRGYTSYTGFLGLQWQVLTSLNVSGQGGASYTETAFNQTLISPYAALSVYWKAGQRSSLSFNYSHEITPTDQPGANAQTSDRASANFNYDITSSLSSHLQLIFTQADVSQNLINSRAINSYSEDDYGVDTGLTYHYNYYLDFNCGIDISGVNSEENARNYRRDEGYVGVRGTY